MNVAAQYADWLTPGEVKSVDEIEPGSGAVLRRGLTQSCRLRDDHGTAARDVGRLPAPRLHRALEHGRDDLGLPVPRLAIRCAQAKSSTARRTATSHQSKKIQ